MNYCDLHCDTPLELFERNESLAHGSLNITKEKFRHFDRYVQLAAYCVPQTDGNSDGFDKFFKVSDYFRREAKNSGCMICESKASLKACVRHGTPAFILTVEDARILDGDITRLELLYKSGVRVLTPLWGGESCIGGSHESSAGLTAFGKEVMHVCAKLGVITDISHASYRSADDILNIAAMHGMPVIASHSCAYGLNPHSRNLKDEHLRGVASSGGVVGVNLYPPHLTGSLATLDDAVRHLSYYISEVGEDYVSLGCDFDGMGIFTEGGEDVGCISTLSDKMRQHSYSDELCEKVLFANAYSFLKEHISDGD